MLQQRQLLQVLQLVQRLHRHIGRFVVLPLVVESSVVAVETVVVVLSGFVVVVVVVE